METSLICAGFGGQGVMVAGQLLCYTACDLTDQYVTFFPSYGSQMRGGTANCYVVLSEEPIGAAKPRHVDYMMIFNNPSMLMFRNDIKQNGTMFVNTTVVNDRPTRSDIKVIDVPASAIAVELGNVKIANLVMLGAFVGYTDLIPADKVIEEMYVKLGSKHPEFNELNKKAFERGLKIGIAAKVNG